MHDVSYSAALVAKTIADNDGLVNDYAFWVFLDLFEENGQYAARFHGGFGLQNIHTIPKPTYRILGCCTSWASGGCPSNAVQS